MRKLLAIVIAVALFSVVCEASAPPAVFETTTSFMHDILSKIPVVRFLKYDLEGAARDRIETAKELVEIAMGNSNSTYADVGMALLQDPLPTTNETTMVYTPAAGHVISDANTYLSAIFVFAPVVITGVFLLGLMCCMCCAACLCGCLPCRTTSIIVKMCGGCAQCAVSILTIITLLVVLAGLLSGAGFLGFNGYRLSNAIGSDVIPVFYDRWMDIYHNVVEKLHVDIPPYVQDVRPWEVLDTIDPAMEDIDDVLTYKTAINNHVTAITNGVDAICSKIDAIQGVKDTAETDIQALPGYGSATVDMTIPAKPSVDTSEFSSTTGKIDEYVEMKDNTISNLEQMTFEKELNSTDDFLDFFLTRAPNDTVHMVPMVWDYKDTATGYYDQYAAQYVDMIDSYYVGLPDATKDIITDPAWIIRGVSWGVAGLLAVAVVIVGFIVVSCAICCRGTNVVCQPLCCCGGCSTLFVCCQTTILMIITIIILAIMLPSYKIASDVCYDWSPSVERLTQYALNQPAHYLAQFTSFVADENDLHLGSTNVINDLLHCSNQTLFDIIPPSYLEASNITAFIPEKVWDFIPQLNGTVDNYYEYLGLNFSGPLTEQAKSLVGGMIDIQKQLDEVIAQITTGISDVHAIVIRDFDAEIDYPNVKTQIETAQTKVSDKNNLGWDQTKLDSGLTNLNSEMADMLDSFDTGYTTAGCPGSGQDICNCKTQRDAHLNATWDASPGDGTTYLINLDKTTDFTTCMNTNGYPPPAALTDAVTELESAQSIMRIIDDIQTDLNTPTTGHLPALLAIIEGLRTELGSLVTTVTGVETTLTSANTKLEAINGTTILDPLYANITTIIDDAMGVVTNYTQTVEAALDCTIIGDTTAEMGVAACDVPQTWLLVVCGGLLVYMVLLFCQCFLITCIWPAHVPNPIMWIHNKRRKSKKKKAAKAKKKARRKPGKAADKRHRRRGQISRSPLLNPGQQPMMSLDPNVPMIDPNQPIMMGMGQPMQPMVMAPPPMVMMPMDQGQGQRR